MSVPDLSALAETVFTSYPEDVKTLNAECDQCEADRAAFGEDDERVQAGERRVNNLKGLFTRRIAWACAQHDARFGLRRKTTGAIATRPSDGLTHSTDVLMMQDDGQIIDVMSDRHSSWSVNPGDTQPLDQWVKPLPPEGEPVPAPTPTPEPTHEPAPDAVSLDAVFAPFVARMDALENRLAAIELKPAPEPAPAVMPKLVAVGKVHVFGFNYDIRLPVVRA